ncbi:MAG: DbpA RNA binding domain-containing protein, partial [Muribaculaceae bacterium]|nr:DbpA RNA binding domain-containing protein [Muribaculaceae bacterium]
REREQAVALFNNGSRPVLVATDLAALGLDIDGVKSNIHYQHAQTPETYTHRHGRTARVDREGDVYVLVGPEEEVKPFSEIDDTYYPDYDAPEGGKPEYESIYFSAGKREKLSKGDILGFLTKECGVPGDAIGKIDVYDHYALAAVKSKEAAEAVANAKGKKIKGEKRIISLL